jgi:hypothetical protein
MITRYVPTRSEIFLLKVSSFVEMTLEARLGRLSLVQELIGKLLTCPLRFRMLVCADIGYEEAS